MATALSRRRALLDPASRQRVRLAKSVLIGGCAAAFGLAFVLTKASHPSHAKHRLTRLEPPASFVQQIRDDQLRGGVVAAPQAPPEAQTATS